jgi:hypothetical protein
MASARVFATYIEDPKKGSGFPRALYPAVDLDERVTV